MSRSTSKIAGPCLRAHTTRHAQRSALRTDLTGARRREHAVRLHDLLELGRRVGGARVPVRVVLEALPLVRPLDLLGRGVCPGEPEDLVEAEVVEVAACRRLHLLPCGAARSLAGRLHRAEESCASAQVGCLALLRRQHEETCCNPLLQ